MPATKTKKSPARTSKKIKKQPKTSQPPVGKLKSTATRARKRQQNFLSRRPHRSFKLTRRRDYVRSLDIPGYIAFTAYTWKTLWSHKRLFGGVLLTYALLNSIFIGLSSQDAYSQLSTLLQDTGAEVFSGGWGQIGQAGLLLASGIGGSFAPQLTEAQQAYAILFLLLTWLTTVWLLRAIMAGGKPKLRDAIYNAGAPIVPTGLVLLVIVLQLVPLTIATIVLNVANSTGFIADGGAIAMMIWLVMILLALISVYWITSTLLALVIITLPGMYPLQAIRTAGDLVIGRRIRILLRLLWMLLLSGIIWVLVVLPTILLDTWLKDLIPALEALPLVPLVIGIVTSFATLWGATYIYLLYRKVVQDDAEPA